MKGGTEQTPHSFFDCLVPNTSAAQTELLRLVAAAAALLRKKLLSVQNGVWKLSERIFASNNQIRRGNWDSLTSLLLLLLPCALSLWITLFRC